MKIIKTNLKSLMIFEVSNSFSPENFKINSIELNTIIQYNTENEWSRSRSLAFFLGFGVDFLQKKKTKKKNRAGAGVYNIFHLVNFKTEVKQELKIITKQEQDSN